MFAPLVVTTLVLVAGAPWVLPAAAGRTRLKPPQDVDVDIVDETFTLRWNGSLASAGSVTFSADYQIPGMVDDWTELPGCQHVTGTECDFSALEMNVYEQIKLRVRAEEGHSTSPWHELEPFIPFERAQIGPPKVHLEAEDKAIIINISPPGAEGSIMWEQDILSFVYSVVSWRSPSGVQMRNETIYPSFKIYRLSPETTYCVKVKAGLPLQSNAATFSPVHCVNTTVENKLPSPENVHVALKGQDFVLTWDYTREDVTFQAQLLSAYLKKTPGSYSGKWAQIQDCEHVTRTQCVLPRSLYSKGIYFVRVRASRGNSTSYWSEEEKFDAERLTVIPRPVVTLKPAGGNALRVHLGAQDRSAFQHYPLTYEVSFWENTSDVERTVTERGADFLIPNLKPLTVYCVKAQALLEDGAWSRRSVFSSPACEETGPGNAPRTWLVAVIAAVPAAPLVVYAAILLVRLVNYVCFPSSKPPSTIDEYFPEEPLKNLLLSTSVEQVEKCFIIENVDIVSIGEASRISEDPKIYNSQTSQDSGHYSNEDENSGSQASEELGRWETVTDAL